MILPVHARPLIWVRRIGTSVVLLLGLATLYYLYFDQLPELASIIPIRPKISPSSSPTPASSDMAGLASIATPTSAITPAKTSWAINPILEKHWQTWKVNTLNLSEPERSWTLTWREKNPNHRYELLTNGVAENFVKAEFGLVSDVTDTFLALRDNITRADMIRYLLLYGKGGVYSDIDTRALKPINTWIPKRHEGTANVVIGLEIDEPDVMWVDWADNFCFCQSTMMASAGHRIFEIVTQNIIRKLNETAKEQKTDLAHVTLTFQDVLRITGPVAFTEAVFQYLSETMGQTISRANFSGMNVPKRMADVLVLPTVAFVPGQAHSQSGTVKDEGALVEHMGMGSWRKLHVFDKDKGKTPEQVQAEEEKKKQDKDKKKQEEEKQKLDQSKNG